MTSKSNSTKSEQSLQVNGGDAASFIVVRKRTLVIYALAMVVISCATAEWVGQCGYSQTVARLRNVSENGESVLTLAMVRQHEVAGFPVEQIIKFKGETVCLFWWPSLFEDRKILLRTTDRSEESMDRSEESIVTSFNVLTGEPSKSAGGPLLPISVKRHPYLYRNNEAKRLINRKEVQLELRLSPEQIANVKANHCYLVPEILNNSQYQRLSQIELQTKDPRMIFPSYLPELIGIEKNRFDELLNPIGGHRQGSPEWPYYYSDTNEYDEDAITRFRDLEAKFRKKLTDEEEHQYYKCLGKPFGDTWYTGKPD